MMTIRMFTCNACGHKMRLSGQHCHKCYHPKHSYQKRFTVVLSTLALVTATVVLLMG